MKRNPLDVDFSKLVRLRSNYTCEHCGKRNVSAQGLDCSHLWGRKRRSVRWHPSNAAAHCMGCHAYLGANPILFAAWIKKHLGDQHERIRDQAQAITHWKKADLAEIRAQLKSELKRVQKMRDEGHEGRIEFSVPFVEDV